MDIEYRSQRQQDIEENVWCENEAGATAAQIAENGLFAATGKEPRIKRYVCHCEVCGKLWNSWEKQMLCSPKCRKTYYGHD